MKPVRMEGKRPCNKNFGSSPSTTLKKKDGEFRATTILSGSRVIHSLARSIVLAFSNSQSPPLRMRMEKSEREPIRGAGQVFPNGVSKRPISSTNEIWGMGNRFNFGVEPCMQIGKVSVISLTFFAAMQMTRTTFFRRKFCSEKWEIGGYLTFSGS